MRLPSIAVMALAICAFAPLPLIGASGAAAQVKPMHSGHLSHGAPQMRRHGSGLFHPNRPHYHHHFGHHGFRPVHGHHHAY